MSRKTKKKNMIEETINRPNEYIYMAKPTKR